MTTQTHRITPDCQPVFPCWLWGEVNAIYPSPVAHWRRSQELPSAGVQYLPCGPATRVNPGVFLARYWLPDSPEAPTVVPEQESFGAYERSQAITEEMNATTSPATPSPTDPRIGKLTNSDASALKTFAESIGAEDCMPAWMKQEIAEKTTPSPEAMKTAQDAWNVWWGSADPEPFVVMFARLIDSHTAVKDARIAELERDLKIASANSRRNGAVSEQLCADLHVERAHLTTLKTAVKGARQVLAEADGLLDCHFIAHRGNYADFAPSVKEKIGRAFSALTEALKQEKRP